MYSFGDDQEFEAKNPDEIISCLKKIYKLENSSDEMFLNKMKSIASGWSGANLNVHCNLLFVKSLEEFGFLVNLSNQSERQRSELLSNWSETGFGTIDFGKLTSGQLAAQTKLALRFREIAKSVTMHNLEETLNCEIGGTHYQKRYALLTDELQKIPLKTLHLILKTIEILGFTGPESGDLHTHVYIGFPDKLFDFAVMWQFNLNLPMGLEFVRASLVYCADLLTQHPNHRHDLISDYLPSQRVPTQPKLYFAYGSNMDHQQMLSRCPSAEFVGLASLKNFEYYIDNRGVASLKPKYGATTSGVVWDVQDSSDWVALDRYEGVASNFYKRHSTVVNFGGQSLICQGYISTTPELGRPRSGYQEKITESVIFHKNYYEKEYSKMDRETASELGWDCYEYPFKLWQSEMNSWLGS